MKIFSNIREPANRILSGDDYFRIADAETDVVGFVKAKDFARTKFRLPANAKIAALGSSSVENNGYTAEAGGIRYLRGQAQGQLVNLRQRDPRLNFIQWFEAGRPKNLGGGNYGFSGTEVPYQATFIPEIIAKGYHAVILANMGQNDLGNAANTVSDVIARVRSVVEQFQAAGVFVYLNTLNPRATPGNVVTGGLAATDRYYRKRIEYNIKLAELADELGCEFIDTRAALENPLSGIREAKTGVSYDGLHMTPYGAALWAEAALPVFRRTIAGGSAYPLLAASAGNIFSNPALTGTGGQNGPNSTGTFASNVRIGRLAAGTGLAVASEMVSCPEGGNAIRSTITATSASAVLDANRWNFSSDATQGDWGNHAVGAAGQWVRGSCRVFIESGGEYLHDLMLIVETRPGIINSVVTGRIEEGVSGFNIVEPVGSAEMLNGKSLWFVTDPFLAPAGTAALSLKLEAQMVGTGVTVMEVSQPALRYVADPRL